MSATSRRIHSRQPQTQDQLPQALPGFLRRVYVNRGVGRPEQLQLELRQLLPFHQLKGMDRAVQLLKAAIAEQLHILIVGDFDADGATSTALAISALGRFGAENVSYLVPDRFRFGYGLTPEIVALAAERQADLIMTVDNGTSSMAGVAAARAAGIQVLVTDHHLPGTALPEADAIVNPNQPGCAFPSKNLAGVGVVFYVMAALRADLRATGQLAEDVALVDLLDLVALGTVADLVPLDHNNRVMVRQGLARMRAGRIRPGIEAIATVAGRDLARLSEMDLGYFIGPRLNAAGRLEDMSIGIECLLSGDMVTAVSHAQRLQALNMQRRELQDQMQAEAETLLQEDLGLDALPYSLCLYDQQWHEGIVGLVASKVKERYHRPSIAFAPSSEPGVLKGSARSINGLHIRDALDTVASRHPEILSKFGGHAMAAGMSINAADLNTFRDLFETVVRELLSAEDLSATVETDGELLAEELCLDNAKQLALAGPWGQRFPQPVFHGRFKVIQRRVVGERHLKLRLNPVDSALELEAIAFNAIEHELSVGDTLLLAYRMDINDYGGRQTLQLVVEHMDCDI